MGASLVTKLRAIQELRRQHYIGMQAAYGYLEEKEKSEQHLRAAVATINAQNSVSLSREEVFTIAFAWDTASEVMYRVAKWKRKKHGGEPEPQYNFSALTGAALGLLTGPNRLEYPFDYVAIIAKTHHANDSRPPAQFFVPLMQQASNFLERALEEIYREDPVTWRLGEPYLQRVQGSWRKDAKKYADIVRKLDPAQFDGGILKGDSLVVLGADSEPLTRKAMVCFESGLQHAYLSDVAERIEREQLYKHSKYRRMLLSTVAESSRCNSYEELLLATRRHLDDRRKRVLEWQSKEQLPGLLLNQAKGLVRDSELVLRALVAERHFMQQYFS